MGYDGRPPGAATPDREGARLIFEKGLRQFPQDWSLAYAAAYHYLFEIQEKTKNIKDHIYRGDKSVTYTNLLLYGPPGTGKTMFAKVLADYTNMDFLPVTAASLMQDPVAFSNIVEMANRSSYGTIIFIDEADALFLDRNEL